MVPRLATHQLAADMARRILVVEDEVLIRIDISEVLSSAGFEVIEASTADEAIRILESGISVSVVITDIRMPGEVDGLDLANYVKTHHSKTWVIVTSGNLPAAQLDPVFSVFISKPYTHDMIIMEIKKRLAQGPPKPNTP